MVDWGYPRTSRAWQRSKPQSTLTPGLTDFFQTIASKGPQATQQSLEADLFRSGSRQVENAVLALSNRRQELEQDIKSLEVIAESAIQFADIIVQEQK